MYIYWKSVGKYYKMLTVDMILLVKVLLFLLYWLYAVHKKFIWNLVWHSANILRDVFISVSPVGLWPAI